MDSDEDVVGAQDRVYDITSSESDSEDEDDEEDDADEEPPKPAPINKNVQSKAKWAESSSDSSDDEEDDPELMAERGQFKKPGGRDRYGKATKGKKGK